MAVPFVIAANGIGIPVTEALNGLPYEIAANGFGTPVVFVPNGGTPVTGGGVLPAVSQLDFGAGTFVWNGQSYPSFSDFLANSGASFSRPSPAYDMPASTLFASNAPRVSSGVLLLEPAGTNLIPQSQLASGWTAARATLTPNNVAAPDGAVTGANLREDATASNTHGVSQTIATALAAVRYHYSTFYRRTAGSRNISHIIFDTTFANFMRVGVDLGNGSINLAADIAGGFSAPRASVLAVANSFFRATVSAVALSLPSFIASSRMASGTAASYSGDNTSALGVWGAQMEAAAPIGYFASSPSSYIPSTAGQGVRSADAWTIPMPAGTDALLVTFDDDTIQQVNAPTGVIDPAKLNRPFVKKVEAIAAARIIATNGRISNALLAADAAKTTFESRYQITIGADTPWVQLALDNWASSDINGAAGDLLPPDALTVEGLAFESDALGVARPALFAGQRSASIAAGRTALSDRLNASAFGLSKFSRGEIYWVRLRGRVSATGRIPSGGRFYQFAGTFASRFDPAVGGNSVSQVDATGPMTGKTGEDNVGQPMSITAVLGRNADFGIPSVLGVGTSIATSANDSAGTSARSGPAFISRSAFDSSNGHPVPMLNVARGSSKVTLMVEDMSRKGFYFSYATALVDEHGTNDLLSSGVEPAFEAADQALRDFFRARSFAGNKIFRTKILPRPASSTDGWTTVANQTTDPTFVTNSGLANAYIDNLLATAKVDYVVPFPSMHAAGSYDKWPANATDDGTHPVTASHLTMTAELRAALEAAYPAIAA